MGINNAYALATVRDKMAYILSPNYVLQQMGESERELELVLLQ